MASHSPMLTVPEEARAPLRELDGLLAAGITPGPVRAVLGRRSVDLSPATARLVGAVVHALARGEAVTVTDADAKLTTKQAADLLGTSRQRLTSLFKRGVLPFTQEGRRRLVRLDDVLAYRARLLAARDDALNHLIALSEELGLYDD